MAGEALERSESDNIGLASLETPAGGKLETGLKAFHSLFILHQES